MKVIYALIILCAVSFAQLTDPSIPQIPPPPRPGDPSFVTSMRLVYVCGMTDGVITTLAKVNQADKMAQVLELRSHVDCQSVYDITGYKPATGTKEHAPAPAPYQ